MQRQGVRKDREGEWHECGSILEEYSQHIGDGRVLGIGVQKDSCRGGDGGSER